MSLTAPIRRNSAIHEVFHLGNGCRSQGLDIGPRRDARRRVPAVASISLRAFVIPERRAAAHPESTTASLGLSIIGLGATQKKKAIFGVAAIAALIWTPAFATPPEPVPYSWTGFYAGFEVGDGWGGQAVNLSPNDPLAALLLSGGFGFTGEQPVASGYRVSQSGAVGGLRLDTTGKPARTDYWDWKPTSVFPAYAARRPAQRHSLPPIPQPPTNRRPRRRARTGMGPFALARVGWQRQTYCCSGTGGFACTETGGIVIGADEKEFSFNCIVGVPYFAGSTSAVGTGWTAGGGVEWLFDQHWSAKIEYRFVDLGTQTVRVTATEPTNGPGINASCSTRPSAINSMSFASD